MPAILQSSPQLQASPDDLLPAFLKINNDLRRMNNETIAALAKKTAPTILWDGAFQPLGGSQIESSFADFRTYLYDGKDVDRQVHLGFDLAKTANAPVTAANNGKVVFAAELGIYGNTVIVDHGMGVQSLYGHLSSFAVKEGDDVKKGQTAGRERPDRPGRRRSPALQHAGERTVRERDRVVGSALDRGPHHAQVAGGWCARPSSAAERHDVASDRRGKAVVAS